MDTFTRWTQSIGNAMEALGVVAVSVGALVAVSAGALEWRSRGISHAYRTLRRGLARSILLGLEFLVAGDIIRTVVVEPTWQRVGTLAVVVAIRTFLSFSLEVEISGRWPWQRREASEPSQNHENTSL